MSDGAGLLRAILETPEDDALRLVYADWLEEQGGERNAKRAELIRVQLKIADLDNELLDDTDCGSPGCEGCKERRELRVCEHRLLAWASDYLVPAGWIALRYPTHPQKWKQAVFDRGFVDRVACPGDEWPKVARFFEREPVRTVELTTWPKIGWKSGPGFVHYFVEGIDRWVAQGDGIWTTGDAARHILAAEWPRIKEWILPPG